MMKRRDKTAPSPTRGYTRREALRFGMLATVFLASGLLGMTPAGKVLASKIEEEVDHNTVMPSFRPTPEHWSDQQLTVTWLGHASFLLNFFGTRIIIDPALESRIGITPVGNRTIGLKRYIAPALTSEEVGAIDLLLTSHAHTDHFDLPSLRGLQSLNTVAVTAKNTKKLWQGFQFKSVEELHWGESKSFSGVTVQALQGKHWGARLPWNKEMEANSFLLSKNGINIFFGGDTAYTEMFKQQLEATPIHLAIIGIGCYSPKSFETRHANPEQAWQMCQEIGAQWVIPMHWGTFKLASEPLDEPLARFRQAAFAAGQLHKIALQEVGATWIMPQT